MVWLASLAAVAAVAVLRFSWSRPYRSHGLNALGWGLMLVAAVLGWSAAGAWGASVATLAGMGGASLIVLHAAWDSRASAARPSNSRAGMLPQRGEPLRLGRRIATFVLVVLVVMAAAIAVAIGLRALALAAGASEADANALALFAMPLVWALLSYAMLMEARRVRQIAYIGIALLAGVTALAGVVR